MYMWIYEDWKNRPLTPKQVKEAAKDDLNAQFVWRSLQSFNMTLRRHVGAARVNSEVCVVPNF